MFIKTRRQVKVAQAPIVTRGIFFLKYNSRESQNECIYFHLRCIIYGYITITQITGGFGFNAVCTDAGKIGKQKQIFVSMSINVNICWDCVAACSTSTEEN